MKSVYLFLSALLVVLAGGAALAQSNYYVPSVNYNEMNHLRYPLATADSSIKNYKNRGTLGTDYNADGYKNVFAWQDETRGWVTNFEPDYDDLGGYVEFPYPVKKKSEQASLSFWVKPLSGNEFIMSRGNRDHGFSLYTYHNDWTLRLVTWGDTVTMIESDRPLKYGQWNHVAIVQWQGGTGYLGLYINNKLAAKSTGAFGGLVPTHSANGYIGSAAKKGKVQGHSGLSNYERGLSNTAMLDGVRPFFSGFISDVRYFATDLLGCADKTQSDYDSANRSMAIGTRCSLKSDIMSLATDRIEPAGLIARFPYRRDIKDHGPNQTVVSADNTLEPGYLFDDLRLDKAIFYGNNLVSYGNEKESDATGNLINTHDKGPFALSFWVQVKDPGQETIQMLYKAGSENEGGINIYVQKNYLYFGAWRGSGDDKWFLKSKKTINDDNWHHIAVSYDPARAGAGNATQAALTAYIDGQAVGTVKMKAVEGKGQKYTTIGAKGPNSTRYYDGTDDKYKNDGNFFTGSLSEVKVYAFPLSKPQVRQLASHYPAAYDPQEVGSVPYGSLSTGDVVDGYQYYSSTPSIANPGWRSTYQYDSVKLKFVYDWSQEPTRWTDPQTGQETQDCEYAMAGIIYDKDSVAWDEDEPTAVYLCFSPSKITNNIAPFTLALGYGRYRNTLYLPIFDALMPPRVLNALQNFLHGPVYDTVTTFDLSIGKFNTILTVQTKTNLYEKYPVYIGPVFIGAKKLVEQVFNVATSTDEPLKFFAAAGNVTSDTFRASYMNQKELLDELDIKFSKDR